MNTITFGKDSCSIICPPDTILTELSFSLEFMSNNFLGRGVNCWSVDRMKDDSGGCIVTGKAMVPSGPMQISQVANLGAAVQQKIIPTDIPLKDSFRFRFQEKTKETLAHDGQNRISRRLFNKPGIAGPGGNWTESLIESKDIDPNGQLAMYSYGFADMATGLFVLGVNNLKYQFTRMTSQLYLRHQLDDNKLMAYFQNQGLDYPIDATVRILP